jgi:nucleoside-diphosphate-sugar epimerase
VIPEHLADAAPWLQHLLRFGYCRIDLDRRRLELQPLEERFALGGISFVHVEDVATTIADNLFRESAHGTVAMLADAEYVSFQELAEHYAGLARQRGLTVETAWTVPPAGRGGEAMFRFNTSLAAERLGFASRDGKSRLLTKATTWFRTTIG